MKIFEPKKERGRFRYLHNEEICHLVYHNYKSYLTPSSVADKMFKNILLKEI